MSKAHALLSPSAAHRWLHCTVSPRFELEFPDRGSSFAEEGTLAHALCAKRLKEFLDIDTAGEDAEIAELEDRYRTPEMESHAEAYAAAVLERLSLARRETPDARLLVETRLDFSARIPDAFGTADALIIADGTLEVIDFKYGKGVRVEAENNPQMMIYALGAYDAFCLEYDIRTVSMTIVQPRLDNMETFSMPVDGLLEWADSVLRPKAEAAWSGKGHTEPGEWGRFRKAAGSCRALTDMCYDTAARHAAVPAIPDGELASDVLPLLSTVRIWLEAVEKYALERALAGAELSGWKIVEGRSNRVITDPGGAADALKDAGFIPEQIYRPRELRTITDLEKTVGRKNFAILCGPFITKPQGKPTLVPESDKRPAISPAALDFKDVGPID